jgi:3-hydroxyisobutyrate dehydrogenase-like beta-hydroxyacid dehydrogenase
MKPPTLSRIAIIGFGEAGGIFGRELAQQGIAVCTYDILLEDTVSRETLRSKASRAGVAVAASHAAAASSADLVISAVTATSALDVARTVGPHLAPSQIYLDINSVSPDTKRKSARFVEAKGGSFIEAAVMGAVPPKKLRVEMLLGGKDAAAASAALNALGFATEAVAERVGVASAIKMCRSVMIKGIEALTIECLLGARRYGAEEQVLASLERTFPAMGWTGALPDYLISRVAEHGRRRAAEMREVAATLEDGGISPRMAAATAALHDWFVDAARTGGTDPQGSFAWRRVIDGILRSDEHPVAERTSSGLARAP